MNIDILSIFINKMRGEILLTILVCVKSVIILRAHSLVPDSATTLTDIRTAVAINNLNSEGWYYGGMTEASYITDTTTTLINNNVTVCPLSAPFINAHHQCFACPPATLYNLYTLACDACSATVVCVRYITNAYQPSLLYAGDFTDYITYYKSAAASKTDCPNATPYYSVSLALCIACPPLTPFFDLNHNQCVNCPLTFIYSLQMRKCVPAPTLTLSQQINKIQ